MDWRTDRGELLLIEAKANAPEAVSPPSQASEQSLELITRSLDEAKPSFGARLTADWSQTYYQYANRLAHLYLLRELNGLPAYLVFLYFLNATDVDGPATAAEWETEIARAHKKLALGVGDLSPFAINAFVDVVQMGGAVA